MIYEVINGKHRDGINRYKVGDQFESDKDLIKSFPNKFKEIITKDVINVAPEVVEDDKKETVETAKEVVAPKKAKRGRKKKAK